MVTEPEQPKEEPIITDQPEQPAGIPVAVKNEDKDDVDDTAPLTVKETIERGKRIVQTAKHGILKPAYRFGRRTMRSAQSATEAFFEGVLDNNKDKK